MKKLKIKKHMTSFLMLAVMIISIIGVMPKTVAFASTFSYVKVESWRGKQADKYTYSWSPVGGSAIKYYVAYSTKHDCIKFFAISKGKSFRISSTEMNNDSISDTYDHDYTDSVYVDDTNYYYYTYGYFYSLPDGNTNYFDFQYSGASGTCLFSEAHTDDEFARYFISGKFPDDCDFNTTMTSTDNQPDGSSTNPIRDENVGYPNIYDYQFLIVKPKPLTGHFDNTDGDYDKLKNADYFKWKSKSTTGFNLTSPSDEYKDVYIQTKIVSKFKYNDKFNGKGEWHNYDNYGEVGYIPFVSASEKKLSVSFQQLTETLPKTFMETHNFKYQYQDYDYYFRIVYTRADDLKVIPTYYSGGWRRVSLHSNNGKHDENGEGDNSSAVIEDGDDDGGEWKKDEDSKDNDKNIDNGTTDGNDLDDAADNADNKNNSSSSGLNINNIKGFMNQVGNVPKAIGKLFTFLPDWVQQFIGFGFVVLVALMIIKAIRG